MKSNKLKPATFNYDIVVIDDNTLPHYICPGTECKTTEDAIQYYMKHFYNPNNKHANKIKVTPIQI